MKIDREAVRTAAPMVAPVAIGAPVVSWLFSEPDRLFSGVIWAAGAVFSIAPGPLLAGVAAIGVTGFALVRGMAAGGDACGVCGVDVSGTAGELLPEHEGGHTAGAEKKGYRVKGAMVEKHHGFTRIPGWDKDPWDQMVIAACGAAGERLGGASKSRLSGSKYDSGSDTWVIHQLASVVAQERGITPEKAIRLANAEAYRVVSSNSRRWREVRDVLREDGQFGSVN